MKEIIIAKTRVKKLHNMEHIEFHAEFVGTVREAGAEVHRSADLVAKHDARFAILDEGLKRIVKSPRTEELQKADKERDETYRGLVAFNKAMTLHHEVLIHAAAVRVLIVINTYKNVAAMNYEEETSAIDNLVQDLKSAKYAPDVQTIGATQWVLTLETRNNKFKSLMGSRDHETAATEHHIAVKEARSRLDKIYSRIKSRIHSYVDDDAVDPDLEALIKELNVVARRFNTLIARRDKHGKKDDHISAPLNDHISDPLNDHISEPLNDSEEVEEVAGEEETEE